MISIAPDVRLPRDAAICAMILAVKDAFESRGFEAVITSGVEGKHMRGSEHYAGHALDWRTKHLPSTTIALEIRDEVVKRLGTDFDVILESEPPHLHTEWDPK